MFSIVEIGGKQYNVKKGDIITVEKLDKKVNEEVEFDNVILIKDNKDIKTGNPYIKDAKVKATVIDNQKDKKVIVFKFKRKKNYKRLKGHRQPYTMIKIEGIVTK